MITRQKPLVTRRLKKYSSYVENDKATVSPRRKKKKARKTGLLTLQEKTE